jgi:hypothetical protein
MSTQFSIDRESFQKLLADAFAVQESGLDTQSLSAILELQRSIATGEPDVDRTINQVADHARNVANATGIAIALLRGDRLVYQAGSGSAATYVGRHLTATLSATTHNKARSEILRVENAQTDARIEAAICRQFEAQSLLMLPIYHERTVAGVLHVLFSEAHAFQDREMRTYRIMAGLVEEAMSREAELDQKKARATQPVTMPHAIEQITYQMQQVPEDDKPAPERERKYGIGRICEAATAVARELPDLSQVAKPATTITHRMSRLPQYKLRWSVAVTAVVTALVIVACWIAYDRGTASPVGTSSLQRSHAARQQIPFVGAKPSPSHSASNAPPAVGGRGKAKAPSSAFMRAQVGPNEVDYIAEDVTIRRFTPKPTPPRVGDRYKEVHIGGDVTVRYFASKPAVVSQRRPVLNATSLSK